MPPLQEWMRQQALQSQLRQATADPRGSAKPPAMGFYGPGGLADVLKQRVAEAEQSRQLTQDWGNLTAEQLPEAMGPVMGMLGPTSIKIPVKSPLPGGLNEVRAWKNPTRKMAKEIIGKAKYKELKGMVDPKGDLYLWDAAEAQHYDIAKSLGMSGHIVDPRGSFMPVHIQNVKDIDIMNWPGKAKR